MENNKKREEFSSLFLLYVSAGLLPIRPEPESSGIGFLELQQYLVRFEATPETSDPHLIVGGFVNYGGG